MRLLRANLVKPIHSIRFKYRNKPQRERPKVVFPAFAYSHIPNSSSRWVSHLHTNSSKTPGPVLISTSVFLMQSIQGKFKTHFGHGSAALTEIHERTGPTVQHLGDSKMQKTRSHIESLFEVRNSSCRRKKKKRGKDFPLLRG